MASSLQFTALSCGEGPVCHLLQHDGWTVMIGCGWDEEFNAEQLEPIMGRLKEVDAVILSHADLAHLGALTYLVTKCGLTAPVFSTLPVRKMGEMFMTEIFHAKQAVSEFHIFSLEDIHHTFTEHPWTQLRYFQHLKVTEGKLAGLTLTPYNAGHMVGGSVWKIGLKDGSEVLYAVDWCHKKERHLNGATISELCARPALMIAGAVGSLTRSVHSVQRDRELLEVIMSTLRGEGGVLIPVDTAGRMLEVALLLDEFWAQEKLPYPLVVLSHTAPTVFERAQQQLEWMSDHITATFGTKRDNAFQMRCLQPLTSLEKLGHLPAGPKVVLACSPSLDCGFSRDLLLDWAQDPKNTICFVQHARKGSLADRLQRHEVGAEPLVLNLEQAQRVPLQGPELEQYMRQLGQAVELQEEDPEEDEQQQSMQEMHEEMEERDESPRALSGLKAGRSGSLSGRLVAAGSLAHGVLMSSASGAGADSDILMEGFKAPERCSFPMFPDEDEPMLEAWDAYGMVSGLPTPPSGPGALMSALSGAMSSHTHADGLLTDAPTAGKQGAAGNGAVEIPEEEEQPEVPTKLVTSTIELTVQAAIRYFDFDGRPDSLILRQTLLDTAPRNLLLVQGRPDERADLAARCKHALADFRTRVLCPRDGEAVTVVLPPCFTLYLSDQLNASLGLHHMQRYALAQLEAVVGAPDPHHPTMLQLLPSLAEPSGEDVFIADSLNGIQLSHIKKALADAGFESFFQGGRLVCGNIAICKGSHDKAHLVLEGALCEDFYRVRDIIYNQYSVC